MPDLPAIPSLLVDAAGTVAAVECYEPDAAPAPTIEPAMVNATSAAEIVGLSRRYLLTADASGRIGPRSIKIGRRRLWSVAELRRWAAAGCPHRVNWEGQQQERTR